MSELTSLEQLTPDHEAVLAWACELRDLCVENNLDAMTVQKGDAVLRVTKTEAKVTHRTLGLVDVFVEDDGASSPSEQGRSGAAGHEAQEGC